MRRFLRWVLRRNRYRDFIVPPHPADRLRFTSEGWRHPDDPGPTS